MPIYTYRCKDCNYQFEQHQRMSEAPLTECPACGGHTRRVVNSVGVVFKGNGFYVTDSRNGAANGKSNSASTKKDDTKATEEPKSSTPSTTDEKSTTASKSTADSLA
jgi:putative FmdB family regulatory protein